MIRKFKCPLNILSARLTVTVLKRTEGEGSTPLSRYLFRSPALDTSRTVMFEPVNRPRGRHRGLGESEEGWCTCYMGHLFPTLTLTLFPRASRFTVMLYTSLACSTDKLTFYGFNLSIISLFNSWGFLIKIYSVVKLFLWLLYFKRSDRLI